MRKLWLWLCLPLTGLLLLSACSRQASPRTVGELARGTEENRIICLREGDDYVPFLAVDADYGGNVLLIRQDLLSPQPVNCSGSGFYPGSDIDVYLNGPYLDSLGLPSGAVVLSEIQVTSAAALGLAGQETETIRRKVFLLSLTEIGIQDPVAGGQEGHPLAWFHSAERRIAFDESQAASWWLRTPNTYYRSCFYGVGPDGSIGCGNAYDENGIRPALCVSSQLPITEKEGLIEGRCVFVLSQED